jgi:hypothetical protein
MFKIKSISEREGSCSKSGDPAKTKVFIFHDNETTEENMKNRNNRPYKDYAEHIIPKVMEYLGIKFRMAILWNTRAGCSMCNCSPGFILDKHYGKEILVHIE